MYKLIVVAVVVGLVAAGGYLGYRYWQLQSAVAELDASKEISSAEISKDGKVWTVRIASLIDAPPDAVWQALRQPERSSELVPEAYRQSKLLSEEGTTKKLALEVALLSLPVQTMEATLDYDEGDRTVDIRTSGGMQVIDGSFEVRPYAEGGTAFRFEGTATDRVSLPLPEAVIESALREFFVVQVRTIKRAIAGEAPAKGAAQAATPKDEGPRRLCESDDVTQGKKFVVITVAPVPEGETLLENPDKGTFREETEGGSHRRYLAGDVLVDERWNADDECNVTTAVVGDRIAVRFESSELFQTSLEDWVKDTDWKALQEVAAKEEEPVDERAVRKALPAPPRAWIEARVEIAPSLPDPITQRSYTEALF